MAQANTAHLLQLLPSVQHCPPYQPPLSQLPWIAPSVQPLVLARLRVLALAPL